MSLTTEVTARFSAAKLVALTNPDLPSASSNDAARLAAAVTDATAEFEARTGVAYDTLNATHNMAAVPLVVVILMERGGSSTEVAAKARDRVELLLERAANVLGRDRIRAKSTSVLTPSSEQTFPGQIVRPEFDLASFEDLVPDQARTKDGGILE